MHEQSEHCSHSQIYTLTVIGHVAGGGLKMQEWKMRE